MDTLALGGAAIFIGLPVAVAWISLLVGHLLALSTIWVIETIFPKHHINRTTLYWVPMILYTGVFLLVGVLYIAKQIGLPDN